MGLIKKLNKWANSHTNYPLFILRIALGVFLLIKGLYFFSNTTYVFNLLERADDFSAIMWIVHYVGLFHFVGGIMIVFGLLTRLSIILQLPILLGAVSINFMGEMDTSNMLQSSIVLLVALFFLVYGSGKKSADYELKMES